MGIVIGLLFFILLVNILKYPKLCQGLTLMMIGILLSPPAMFIYFILFVISVKG